MTSIAPGNQSIGYETVSGNFMSIRSRSSIGVATVRDWATSLPLGGPILHLGCGHGMPISKALIDEGFDQNRLSALANTMQSKYILG
jgi:hypothetical protein